MGKLIEGQWQTEESLATLDDGKFKRPDSSFREWVEPNSLGNFTPEAGRYHLYLSYACPWACRTLMMRALKGLQAVISVSFVDAYMGKFGWTFGVSSDDTKDPCHPDFEYLAQVYTTATPDYTGRVTVPVLWDKQQNTIVNNESADIMRMLDQHFQDFATTDYIANPPELQEAIDEINPYIYKAINNGVYKCGFANTQAAYDEAVLNLFEALDDIETRLEKQRYLVSDMLITEADWRLFSTLVRFDLVYYSHFKCNVKQLRDYPSISRYLHELYDFDGIADTVNFAQIKEHYYRSQTFLNPTGIVPKGPEVYL